MQIIFTKNGHKLFIILLLLSYSQAVENYKPHKSFISMNKEKSSIENNFGENKHTFNTNNMSEAIGITLVETLLNNDKLNQKKSYNSDFKYLKEFEESLK